MRKDKKEKSFLEKVQELPKENFSQMVSWLMDIENQKTLEELKEEDRIASKTRLKARRDSNDLWCTLCLNNGERHRTGLKIIPYPIYGAHIETVCDHCKTAEII